VSIISIDGGTFQREGHIYRDSTGVLVPSITQILRLQGLTDYSMIAPDVLRNAQERGTEVHDLTAAYDTHGEIDESWITDRVRPYYQAYMKFRAENHFVPDPEWIEKGIIATLFGMKVAMTPDRFGKLNGHDCVLELKCVEAEQPSWAFQTAAQELGVYKSTRAGRAIRIAVQLKKSGKYHLCSHKNGAYDVSQFIAATTTVYGRMNAGQDLLAKLAA